MKQTFDSNYLIGSMDDDEIEVILSENDKELTEQLSIGFADELAHSLADIDMARYNQFIQQMIARNGQNNIKQKQKSKTFNVNGASSDVIAPRKSPPGRKGKYLEYVSKTNYIFACTVCGQSILFPIGLSISSTHKCMRKQINKKAIPIQSKINDWI